MNSVVLIGRVVRDFKCEYTKNGDGVCAFTMAVDRVGKNKATDFIKIKVFGKQAENAAKYLGKGSQVAVNGSLQIDSYEKNDGTKGYDTYVFASRVEYLSKRTESDSTQLASEDTFNVDNAFTEVDDYIPF